MNTYGSADARSTCRVGLTTPPWRLLRDGSMPTLEIDGQQVTVEDGLNLVEAAERLGIEIPHYCYHKGLSIAGNCRMCLVEIEKVPKLQIACNTRVTEGMVVRTQSERVRRARAAVLEFLLLNHPIDCPVCDQAGECKLQDYYMDYDRQPSHVALNEKVRKAKAIDIGPLVMLDQERCILCTRCIRFLEEVTKTGELGICERGDRARITLFPGHRLDNLYSANVVDICPVGALTNKEFRFRARVWYLDHTPSVCPTCATGCNIEIHHRRDEIFRFRPRYNEAVNTYWMCDLGRVSYRRFQGEGRVLKPVFREGDGWREASWNEALERVIGPLREVAAKHGPASIGGIVSAQATTEEAFLFSRLMRDLLQGRLAGFAWSPSEAVHDDFLIDADKNPNTSGLQALGIDAAGAEALLTEASSGALKALLVLRSDFSESHDHELFEKLAAKLELLVVLDTHHHATADHAHVLLPLASFAETDGTFVNRKGRIQRVRPAVEPPGHARAGWQVIGELSALAGGSAVAADAGAVFAQIAASVPAFQSLSYEAIGLAGKTLAGAAA
jgi:NADH-quinone oxidoreductase subunit G